ncbi:MAG: hypothetical protein PVF95_05770 [bacterium]|jgi:hypothetical protein
MEFSGECHGDCTRNTIAYCGKPGGEPYPHGGVWMWSEDARPTFNASELPPEANSFYGNYTCDIGMEPLGNVPEVYAVANYWGCKCPDFSQRLIGPVCVAPWVDSTCTRFIKPPECRGAVEPTTWGRIKALFE